MSFQTLELPAAILITLSCLAGMLLDDFRIGLGLLAAQYLCLFFLSSLHLPVVLAFALFFSGLIGLLILGMSVIGSSFRGKPLFSLRIRRQTPPPLFLLLAAIVLLLFVLSNTARLREWIPTLDGLQSWSALVLLGINLLVLLLDSRPERLVFGLLGIFQGFEIIITGMTSALVAVGLLASTTLLIALIGGYLLTVGSPAEEE